VGDVAGGGRHFTGRRRDTVADVNLQLVREFFELHFFRVLTNWQREPARSNDGPSFVQLFVENCDPLRLPERPDAVLSLEGLRTIERGVIEIRAWHADRFYPSVIENNPVLSQFVSDESLALAREVFKTGDFATILVISELPQSVKPRERSIGLLRQAGVSHVLEFPVILRGLLERVSSHGTYGSSETLQTIRLLKRYQLVRNQQMELPLRSDAPRMLQPADQKEE